MVSSFADGTSAPISAISISGVRIFASKNTRSSALVSAVSVICIPPNYLYFTCELALWTK